MLRDVFESNRLPLVLAVGGSDVKKNIERYYFLWQNTLLINSEGNIIIIIIIIIIIYCSSVVTR